MKKNVLFVDDDQKILESYRRSFRHESYQVLLAKNAEQALQTLKSITIDVMVTDYRMPGLSGLELMSIIRAQYDGICQIMVSGDANKGVLMDALNYCNIFRFFEKPCSIEALRCSIREGLERKNIERHGDQGKREFLIRELERQNPGITEVERDELGVVIVR